MTTIILVCGGREYGNQQAVSAQLDAARAHYGEVFIVHGGARGADYMAGIWCRQRGVLCATVAADWINHKRAAGPRRNTAMLLLQPHVCLAFPGGAGTADMVRKARAAGIPTYEV